MKNLIIITLFLVSFNSFALDVKPEDGVLGLKWESSEQEIISKLGEPNGYFQATKYIKYMFYGKTTVLKLKRGKLKGFEYSDSCCRMFYNNPVTVNERFSNEPLKLDGIELTDKSFSEIAKALPYSMGKPDYQKVIETDSTTIKMSFASSTYNGQKSYSFNGIEISYEL